ADLPLVTPEDIRAAAALLEAGNSHIAPSDDGGTSLIGGHRPCRFAYGPGSFHRHLARADDPAVIVRRGLALDLDRPGDFEAAALLEAGSSPIAPVDDGGTSLIGGHRPFRFAYGPGSFHRHLARADDPAVIVRRGLALDLDGPGDFEAAASLPAGGWLRRYLP